MLLRYTRDLKNLRAFRKRFPYISDWGWLKHVAVTLYDIFINMVFFNGKGKETLENSTANKKGVSRMTHLCCFIILLSIVSYYTLLLKIR